MTAVNNARLGHATLFSMIFEKGERSFTFCTTSEHFLKSAERVAFGQDCIVFGWNITKKCGRFSATAFYLLFIKA